MNIVLLGKDGQVGWELQRALAPLGPLIALDRGEADLDDPERLVATVRRHAPAVIVNAAAYTAVDRAESDAERAQRVNGQAPAALGRLARELGAWLVHYSTDYVFDGEKNGYYVEDDATGPLSVYGASKLAGEQGIVASGCRHLTFRTSWVFAPRGGNFAKTMLKLAAEREQLSVVCDQFGAPTSAELIADVTALCLHRVIAAPAAAAPQGIFHLVAAGESSWCDYARFVLAEAAALGLPLKVTADAVKPIPGSQYPTPARRPHNSRLSTEKLRAAFNLHLPDWRHHARRLVHELVEPRSERR